MSEPLFAGYEPEPVVYEPAAEPFVATERTMLDLLARRYLKDSGNGPRFVYAEHVRNQCGFGGDYFGTGPLRTADALAVDLWPSSQNAIHGFEVKISRSDWLTELKDPEKAEAFRPYCDHWWLVVPNASIVRGDLPDGWGLLVVSTKSGQDWRGRVWAEHSLRVRKPAPKNTDRQPMPLGMTAAWLRAAVKTTDALTAARAAVRGTKEGL